MSQKCTFRINKNSVLCHRDLFLLHSFPCGRNRITSEFTSNHQYIDTEHTKKKHTHTQTFTHDDDDDAEKKGARRKDSPHHAQFEPRNFLQQTG